MVVDWLEMMAGDGTGMIINSSRLFIMIMNIKNDETCLRFIKKHSKNFMDAKQVGVPYVPAYDV